MGVCTTGRGRCHLGSHRAKSPQEYLLAYGRRRAPETPPESFSEYRRRDGGEGDGREEDGREGDGRETDGRETDDRETDDRGGAGRRPVGPTG